MRGGGVVVMLGLCAGSSLAQTAAPLAPGDRVRLPSPLSIEGTLIAIEPTELSIRDTSGRTMQLVRSSDLRLLRYEGPGPCSGQRRAWCVLGGAVGGGMLGAVATMAATTKDPSDAVDPRVVYVGTPLGAVIGAFVGSVVGGDRWRRLRVPAAIAITPSAAGSVVRARLTF